MKQSKNEKPGKKKVIGVRVTQAQYTYLETLCPGNISKAIRRIIDANRFKRKD